MNKVLIFTNSISFNGINDDIKNKIKLLGRYPDVSQPIMFLDEEDQPCLKPVDNLNAEGVYLIYDRVGFDTIEKLIKCCENDELYVLTHTQGIEQKQIQGLKMTKCITLPGKHENGNRYHYKPLFEILGDETKKNKVEWVIKEVFKPSLEGVLRFLNLCLMTTSGQEFDRLKEIILTKLPEGSPVYLALDCFPTHSDLYTLSDLLIGYVHKQN